MTCHLITSAQSKNLTQEQLKTELVHCLIESDHFDLCIVKCKDCNQHFLYCFEEYTTADWEDDLWSFWYPVEEPEVEKLRKEANPKGKFFAEFVHKRNHICWNPRNRIYWAEHFEEKSNLKVNVMEQKNWSQDSYIKVLKFAARAHQGQTVPGSDLPYVVHVCLVAMEVIAALQEEEGFDEDFAVQVALLHDVVEDAEVTYRQIADEFGSSVADGVLALSKDSTLLKNLRMEDSLRRIQQQPREVWIVKMADRITNLQPPPSHWDKTKISYYLEEAIKIQNALSAASPFLSARLLEKIKNYRVHIE